MLWDVCDHVVKLIIHFVLRYYTYDCNIDTQCYRDDAAAKSSRACVKINKFTHKFTQRPISQTVPILVSLTPTRERAVHKLLINLKCDPTVFAVMIIGRRNNFAT